MKDKLAAVVRKRRVLVAHASTQRAELLERIDSLRGPLALADGAFRVGRLVGRHPAVLAAALAILIPLRRPGLMLWSGRVLTLLEVVRALRVQWPRRAGS